MAVATKLTKTLQKKICEGVLAGNYPVTAAKAAGISHQTYYNWMERGKSGEEPFDAFAEAVEHAEAVAEREMVEIVREAASTKQWAAAMTWLERRHSDRWSRHDMIRQEHSGPGGSPLPATISVPPKLRDALVTIAHDILGNDRGSTNTALAGDSNASRTSEDGK